MAVVKKNQPLLHAGTLRWRQIPAGSSTRDAGPGRSPRRPAPSRPPSAQTQPPTAPAAGPPAWPPSALPSSRPSKTSATSVSPKADATTPPQPKPSISTASIMTETTFKEPCGYSTAEKGRHSPGSAMQRRGRVRPESGQGPALQHEDRAGDDREHEPQGDVKGQGAGKRAALPCGIRKRKPARITAASDTLVRHVLRIRRSARAPLVSRNLTNFAAAGGDSSPP
jgi:hypothetical protein